jgi:hypothetical protein
MHAHVLIRDTGEAFEPCAFAQLAERLCVLSRIEVGGERIEVTAFLVVEQVVSDPGGLPGQLSCELRDLSRPVCYSLLGVHVSRRVLAMGLLFLGIGVDRPFELDGHAIAVVVLVLKVTHDRHGRHNVEVWVGENRPTLCQKSGVSLSYGGKVTSISRPVFIAIGWTKDDPRCPAAMYQSIAEQAPGTEYG